MAARSHSAFHPRRLFLPALTALILAYFGYHAVTGSYGLISLGRIDAEAARLAGELAALRAEHEALEARASLMRPGALDPDMLDELARRNLNVIAPNEVIIIP